MHFSSDDDVLGPISKGALLAMRLFSLEQLEDAYGYYVQAAQLKIKLLYTTPMYLIQSGSDWFEVKSINITKLLAFFQSNQIRVS